MWWLINRKKAPIWTEISSLHAESARAVTDRQCPHNGVGEDFLACWPGSFTKMTITRTRKINLKVQNWPSSRGLRTGHWQNFWSDSVIWVPKLLLTIWVPKLLLFPVKIRIFVKRQNLAQDMHFWSSSPKYWPMWSIWCHARPIKQCEQVPQWFSDMCVPELLLPHKMISMFCPKTAKL